MQGKLNDMAVADLIQHSCQDRKTSRLTIESNGDLAYLYFSDGNIIHATLGDHSGEEVVYRILVWEEGTFNMENGIESPTVTIRRNWTSLLLEGAKRLDENNPAPILNQEVIPMATKKSELLTESLKDVLEASTDIEGAAVVGTDGLVYTISIPKGTADESMVGAVAAAVLGSSKRSADQLKRGDFALTLIQGAKGNIIVTPLDPQTLFVALTASDVNLGMAFAEARSAGNTLSEIL